MKSNEEILDDEISENMMEAIDRIPYFRKWILEAMDIYEEQARKDERVKVLEILKHDFMMTCNPDARNHIAFILTQLKESK